LIKRTINFGSPAYLSLKDKQLLISYPKDSNGDRPKPVKLPIEDIGIVILENPQITVSHSLLAALLENNTAVVTSDKKHLPNGMLLNLNGNTLQSEKFTAQINASVPLKKQLWQQTISAKIKNQAALLFQMDVPVRNMINWSKKVRSGDPDNYEARAAAYFWENIFIDYPNFRRAREGDAPNNFLNYGYTILRAVVARSLVGSGLLPTLGIHHHNKYNAYCLADDIMEPYRPYVDEVVYNILNNYLPDDTEPTEKYKLTTVIKSELLKIPAIDVIIDGEKSPLMIAMQRTTSSLFHCFAGNSRKILYPVIN
jgi:CRISPR-associated protein Cas1